jgi:hypothetical protein
LVLRSVLGFNQFNELIDLCFRYASHTYVWTHAHTHTLTLVTHIRTHGDTYTNLGPSGQVDLGLHTPTLPARTRPDAARAHACTRTHRRIVMHTDAWDRTAACTCDNAVRAHTQRVGTLTRRGDQTAWTAAASSDLVADAREHHRVPHGTASWTQTASRMPGTRAVLPGQHLLRTCRVRRGTYCANVSLRVPR